MTYFAALVDRVNRCAKALGLVAALAFAGLAVAVTVVPVSAIAASNATYYPTSAQLEAEIAARIERVPEFIFIRDEAKKLGVGVFLFGGTSAAYAHYVNWDLRREKGDARYQADRFDYDFTSIYRSTQDLDVVVDGTHAQIQKLQEILQAKYPSFAGSKAAWELRSLRESHGEPGKLGYKEALLDSPDFANQNTDSNSTGLISLTGSVEGSVVKDLRDWRSLTPQFLTDVRESKIHFYHSDLHATTPRALTGNNPEIFSVVRALTKAFQYDCDLRADDEAEMLKIIQAFRPEEISAHPQNKNRLIGMGTKLFKHAVDVELAWNITDRLGLRELLMQFDSAQKQGSLAWWMNKSPLRSLK